jgi:NhaA family Na+:H+ antiporter
MPETMYQSNGLFVPAIFGFMKLSVRRLRRYTLDPIQEFLRDSRAVGIILLCCAAVSLLLSNSSLLAGYAGWWVTHLPAPGDLHVPSPLHIINDGLMTLFFLLMGLEIKREFRSGELASRKDAVLPLAAALGGMIAPAILYLAINAGGPYLRGWAVPVATDIAFSLGVLSLLGKRAPRAFRVFLMALAIIDDLGGILIIAVGYTSGIGWGYLGGAALCAAVMAVLNRRGVLANAPYFLLMAPLWYCLLRAGVHPTIAGVVTAFCMPSVKGSKTIHALHDPVQLGILPLFALANTAMAIPSGDMAGLLQHPLFTGVMAGLALGKPIGIAGISYLTVKLGWARLPGRMRWRHMIGLGLVAGIGFTMSIFITALAFEKKELQDISKLAVLIGSAISGVAGYVWLRSSGKVFGISRTAKDAETPSGD